MTAPSDIELGQHARTTARLARDLFVRELAPGAPNDLVRAAREWIPDDRDVLVWLYLEYSRLAGAYSAQCAKHNELFERVAAVVDADGDLYDLVDKLIDERQS